MKKFKILALICCLFISIFFCGCGGGDNRPTKPGGGNRPQPYSPNTGQYEGK